MVGDFPAVLNFNQLFLKLNWFINNELTVLPDHWQEEAQYVRGDYIYALLFNLLSL